MSYLLEANGIVKDYTGHKALDDVTVHVPEGSVYGLLGPNGAGKTTLIRIINHITAPDAGEVIFDGRPLTADDVKHIGYLPEERGLYKKMKVGEQAIFFARLKGLDKRDAEKRLKEWFERMEIGNWWNKKVEELSKGMAQKVQFIITVLHRPKLLIFDEPFSGFDPINANILKREILRLRDEGSTVIFSTHNMSSVEELCDHITLINRSRNILTGNVEELRRSFGGNRFRLRFEGELSSLAEAIKPVVSYIGEDEEENRGQGESVIVELSDAATRRDLVDIANRATDLVGFEPVMPSINNIFINAVRNSSEMPVENK
ncbi:MAG: ATP-binding cassette domain-containing protein [Muribaculaceae bacterium]|jgi:ABC-2 type transport system ATP-binding protein|uniref:ABC transporter ATP-binding protein n=1 Tax=Barnesiella sp. CU968 TaxID=2780099 RepID=UPI000F51A4E2|nr:ATP-binding cassette domain-containing protein [Barnesiella sp. CU968]MBJ2197076.1 ATP-binding cassette domain-containing protein [Muribaculaceae bacterium]MCI9029248.1 ABC transporter ATP-binding protein [Muribaculaceae bacterium]MCX4280365.1 ATP-binding cassette domain-containing protein [Muribaculaceae bacterium]ROS82509.1 ATP-binding cassette domain-containing protein [Muribaculaceae bacterium Isolate-036 (Harlan)]